MDKNLVHRPSSINWSAERLDTTTWVDGNMDHVDEECSILYRARFSVIPTRVNTRHPCDNKAGPYTLTFNNALDTYKKRTKNDLLTHPLVLQLENCTSSSAVLALIHQQLQGLQTDDDRLTRWLDPTVRVLQAFSETLGEGVSLAFSPAKAIFAGVGVLLSAIVIPSQAAMDVRASKDTLIDIFERMESFFQRLDIYTRVSPPPEMIDIIVRIMVEKKYLKKLIGKTDIEDALKRLDKLTNEEGRMVTAQVLEVTHAVDDGVGRVGDG
ncbi:hypothetical protein BGY98DRAFT_940678, partial [Russula aff. rugulosa BPL654]